MGGWAAALAWPAGSAAQAYPTRAVTLIVPFPAGGPTDRLARALAETVAVHLGQPLRVENRPGAGGTLGPVSMAGTARPDGYTISLFPGAMWRVPHLQKVSWNPLEDFSFVGGLMQIGLSLVVRADSPWRTLSDLVAAARAGAAPGAAVDYGSSGIGSTCHLLMERVAQAGGVRFTHVPFKGQADLHQALLGGHVMAICDASGWDADVEAGRLRLLATFGNRPSRRWPQVPTARQQGHDAAVVTAHGLAGPKGMEPTVLHRLHEAFRRAVEEPRIDALMRQLDCEPFTLDGAAYRAWGERTFEEERRTIERLGLLVR